MIIVDTDILNMFAKTDALEMLVTFYIKIRQAQFLTKTTTNESNERIRAASCLQFVPFSSSLSFLLGTECCAVKSRFDAPALNVLNGFFRILSAARVGVGVI